MGVPEGVFGLVEVGTSGVKLRLGREVVRLGHLKGLEDRVQLIPPRRTYQIEGVIRVETGPLPQLIRHHSLGTHLHLHLRLL